MCVGNSGLRVSPGGCCHAFVPCFRPNDPLKGRGAGRGGDTGGGVIKGGCEGRRGEDA